MRQSIEALEPLFCIYSALKLLNHPFLRPNYQFLIGQGKGGGGGGSLYTIGLFGENT